MQGDMGFEAEEVAWHGDVGRYREIQGDKREIALTVTLYAGGGDIGRHRVRVRSGGGRQLLRLVLVEAANPNPNLNPKGAP